MLHGIVLAGGNLSIQATIRHVVGHALVGPCTLCSTVVAVCQVADGSKNIPPTTADTGICGVHAFGFQLCGNLLCADATLSVLRMVLSQCAISTLDIAAQQSVVVRILLVAAIEYAFNVFPATPLSSAVLQVAHLVILSVCDRRKR